MMTILLLVLAAIPLLPMLIAERRDWWQAWVVAAVFSLGFVISRVLADRRNPGILYERRNYLRHEDTQRWDTVLSPLTAFGPIVILVVAGFDARLGWRGDFSLAVEVGGLALVLGGYVLGSWALVENAWFSGTVRVQEERGHAVVGTGPYRAVRHPGYLGSLMTAVGLPLALGSVWAFVPAVAYGAVVVARTALEDRFLHANLAGYVEYAGRVRCRLLPGIW